MSYSFSIKLLLYFSRFLFWFSTLFGLSYLPCMVQGLFGNEVNLIVNIDSGDILWEKKIEFFGSDDAQTKPDLSIASLSFNFTDVYYTDSLSATPLFANSKKTKDLVSVNPYSHSKFVMFSCLAYLTSFDDFYKCYFNAFIFCNDNVSLKKFCL